MSDLYNKYITVCRQEAYMRGVLEGLARSIDQPDIADVDVKHIRKVIEDCLLQIDKGRYASESLEDSQ